MIYQPVRYNPWSRITSAKKYDDFSGSSYTLTATGQTSPDGKWYCMSPGGTGSWTMNGSNMRAVPQSATILSQTFGPGIRTTQQFKDFRFEADVTTNAHTRINDAPKTWEVAWIIWRYVDSTHFYGFNLATNLSEIMKYDGGQNPQDEIIITTVPNPKVVLGQTYHWAINVHQDHIQVLVDDRQIFDLWDKSSFDTGYIMLYNEDSDTTFDNVYIEEVPAFI